MKRIAALVVGLFAIAGPLFFSSAVVHAAERDTDIVKIETMTPIEVGKTRDVDGKLVGLNTKAREAGMADAVLHGTIKYREAGSGKRATIYWDTIKWSNGKNDTEGGLEKPLLSQFTTNDKRVEPQTTLTAKGDVGNLTQSFDNVKKRVAATEAAKAQQLAASPQGQQTPAASNSGVSGGYVPGSGSYDPSSSGSGTNAGSDGLSVDPVSTTYEACPPRIALSEGLVYRQEKEIKKNTAGDILDEGECKDRGGTVPITRDYTGCPANFDFENKVMYPQYKEVADMDGLVLTVSGCTIDTEQPTQLQSTFDGCGVRHDFVNGVSVQLEQLFYRDENNKVVNVGDCQDSTHVYQQYKTNQTCTDQVDSANGFVIPYQRIAYDLDDGTVQYATECQAQSTTGIPIQEEACDPKYEHDFVNSVSYLRTQTFYIDQDGQKQILSACQRSAANSFTHKFDDTGCSISNDDAAMLTHWNAKRFIDTPDDGKVVISDCEEYNSPTPYSYQGNHDESRTVSTRTATVSSFTGNEIKTNAPTGTNFVCDTTYFYGNNDVYCDPGGVNCSKPANVNPCTSPSTRFYVMNFSYNSNYDWWDKQYYRLRTRETKSFMDYLRGDGTTYNKPISTTWNFDAIK